MSKTIELTKFKNDLPKDITYFLDFVYKSGYLLTLVGGAVRDYALYQELSNDLDFEVRSLSNIDDSNWDEEFKKLSEIIGNYPNTKVELLNFNIMRVQHKNIELEISSPRLEVYDNSISSYGHSDFGVHFSNKLSYLESFARRDFSINAIGIEFSEELKIVDPYNGLQAVADRELDYITEDFFKDPVRLLRTLRFKVAHSLQLSRKLKDNLVYFNLDKLTLHYFKQEGRKIGLEKLVFEMDFARRKFALKLPPWAGEFHLMKPSKFARCKELIEIVMHYSVQDKVTEESILSLGQSFLIKKTVIKNLCLLRNLYRLNLVEFKERIIDLSFEEALEIDEFIKLCRLHKSSQKISDNILEFYLPKATISFLKTTLESVDSKEITSHTLSHEKNSMLGIYCHIIKNI